MRRKFFLRPAIQVIHVNGHKKLLLVVYVDAFPAKDWNETFFKHDLVDMSVPVGLGLRVSVEVNTQDAHGILVLRPFWGLSVLWNGAPSSWAVFSKRYLMERANGVDINSITVRHTGKSIKATSSFDV